MIRATISLPLLTEKLLLILLALSFLITGVDVAIAHFQNHFIPRYEWIPIIVSPLLFLVTLLYALSKNKVITLLYKAAMLLGLLIGVVGTLFHVFGNVNAHASSALDWLMIGIPVLAPIAYAGMSLFGLALIEGLSENLLRLIGLGFLVSALTAYLDHASTHFESPFTIIPIISGMFAFMVCWIYATKNDDTDFFYVVMSVMILVGLLGAYVHVITNLRGTVQFSWWVMFYRTPPLAPLVLSQLGVLGILSALRKE